MRHTARLAALLIWAGTNALPYPYVEVHAFTDDPFEIVHKSATAEGTYLLTFFQIGPLSAEDAPLFWWPTVYASSSRPSASAGASVSGPYGSVSVSTWGQQSLSSAGQWLYGRTPFPLNFGESQLLFIAVGATATGSLRFSEGALAYFSGITVLNSRYEDIRSAVGYTLEEVPEPSMGWIAGLAAMVIAFVRATKANVQEHLA